MKRPEVRSGQIQITRYSRWFLKPALILLDRHDLGEIEASLIGPAVDHAERLVSLLGIIERSADGGGHRVAADVVGVL